MNINGPDWMYTQNFSGGQPMFGFMNNSFGYGQPFGNNGFGGQIHRHNGIGLGYGGGFGGGYGGYGGGWGGRYGGFGGQY